MTTFRLKVGKEWIHSENLNAIPEEKQLNDHERKAISFCQSWISGRSFFDFQTSGSTGVPKKITFNRSQLIASAELTIAAFNLQAGSTSLVCLDTTMIAGAMMLVRGMVAGMNMIIQAPSGNPLKNIDEPIHFAAFVPYQLIGIIEHTASRLNSVEKIIIGGAPLSRQHIASLQSFSSEIYATYGMTETITHIAIQRLNGPEPEDYFRLLPGIKGLTDDRGCLVITPTHLQIGRVITNDLVSFIEPDKFVWIGRYDRVINSGGIKISPEKIERVAEVIFETLNISNRFFVDGIPDLKLGSQVAIIIEGQPFSSAQEEKIMASLQQELEKYETPRKIVYIDSFTETASQKVDRLKTLKNI